MMSGIFKTNTRTIVASAVLMMAAFGTGAGSAHASNALGDPVNRAANAGKAGAGTDLTAVVPETKAGEITVGSTNQVVVKFRNDSGSELKIGNVDLYPSSTVGASVALNECMTSKEALPAGAECAIVVSVKGLKIGNWRVEMLVRHDGKARIVTSAMTGTVVAGDDKTDTLLSDIEMIPTELDFGSLSSSRPLVKSVIMRNVTSNPIKVDKVRIDASEQSGYSMNSDCKELVAGQACLVSITWSPLTPGKSDGVLVVEHDGPTRVASVNLKGEYSPKTVEKADIFPEAVPGAGLLVSSQEKIDFGEITNEASMTVSLVNVGDQEMQIKDISLASSDKGLSVANTGCRAQTVLKPVEACALTLKWSPVRTGELVEDVRISHDGARGVLVIPVRGTSKAAVNLDTKAVVVDDKSGAPVVKPADKRQVLEGFVITSKSGKKAIINGPGGSRVVSDGQEIVLGGIDWKINVNDNGVDFLNGTDRVRLLFDRSLSANSRTSSSSDTSSSSSSSSSGSSSSSSSSSGSSSSSSQ